MGRGRHEAETLDFSRMRMSTRLAKEVWHATTRSGVLLTARSSDGMADLFSWKIKTIRPQRQREGGESDAWKTGPIGPDESTKSTHYQRALMQPSGKRPTENFAAATMGKQGVNGWTCGFKVDWHDVIDANLGTATLQRPVVCPLTIQSLRGRWDKTTCQRARREVDMVASGRR